MTKMTKKERDLMLMAAAEIEDLRRLLGEAQRYRVHTERMLAMFEGGPPPPVNQCMGEDVAWALRQAAECRGDATSGHGRHPDREFGDKIEDTMSDADTTGEDG